MRSSMLFLALAILWGAVMAAPRLGSNVPDALGDDRDGNPVRISDHRGKVVVVTFWASWCAYCLKEMPVLVGLQKAVGRERMEVVAVNMKEPARTYRWILRKLKGIDLTMTHDPKGAISDAYGLEAVPRLFMIGKDGRLAYMHTGYSEDSLPTIVDAANRLLREPAPDAAVARAAEALPASGDAGSVAGGGAGGDAGD